MENSTFLHYLVYHTTATTEPASLAFPCNTGIKKKLWANEKGQMTEQLTGKSFKNEWNGAEESEWGK